LGGTILSGEDRREEKRERERRRRELCVPVFFQQLLSLFIYSESSSISFIDSSTIG